MENIVAILKALGIEVPADKEPELNKKVSENYKTVEEVNKKDLKIGTLEEDKKTLTVQLETANTTIAGFKDLNVDELKTQVANWETKYNADMAEAKKSIAERDFNDALNAELANVKFTSEYAKAGVINEIKGAGLTVKDGKILGLTDLLTIIKGKDKSSFVDEDNQNLENSKAKFTVPGKIPAKGTKLTTAELMKLKNLYPELDITDYM